MDIIMAVLFGIMGLAFGVVCLVIILEIIIAIMGYGDSE